MNANVSFRHMDSSPALRDYAVGKLERVVNKYVHGTIDASIVMSVEKIRHIANFTVQIKNLTVKGESDSEDMYSSIDIALDKIERQLRRHKDRLRDHKPVANKNGKSFSMSVIAPLEADAESDAEVDGEISAAQQEVAAVAPEVAAPVAASHDDAVGTFATSSGADVQVTRRRDYEARAMSIDEAVIQLDLMDERQFFIFTNVDSEKINIIYRRAEGTFGLIET